MEVSLNDAIVVPRPRMKNIQCLLRFLYLGQCESVHICSGRETPLDVIVNHLECLQGMLQPKMESYPFKVIKKAMDSGMMPRRDEGFMAIAYCLRRMKNKAQRQYIYAHIGELMVTDVDLFMFVKYATLLNLPEPPVADGLLPAVATASVVVPEHAEYPARKRQSELIHGFGRGMKRAIGNWYASKTSAQLSNIMGRRRGLYRWTHRDLFKLCHIKFDASQKDKLQIMKAMFNRGIKVLREMDTMAPQDQPQGSMVRLCQIFRFKMCEDAKDAAQMFVNYAFDMDQVPSHLLADPTFWTIALPSVPYADMLRILLTLHGYGMLSKHADLKALFVERLGNESEVRSSGVQPLQLLSLINGYKMGQRYPEAVKRTWYMKNRVTPHNVCPDDEVSVQLMRALNHSFANLPKISETRRIIVTVDLRRGDVRRPVFNMENINCREACVCLALGIVKHTPEVRVFAFSATQGLMPLHLVPSDSYEEASRKCTALVVTKTKQSLAAPISLSEFDAKPTHFITIMGSVARIHRQGLKEFKELEKMRQRWKSRYVVMNLGRYQQDLHGSSPEAGLLEICGLRNNIMNLISAYINEKFL